VASSDRYFPATIILGGHLQVDGIPNWAREDPSRLTWEPVELVEVTLKAMMA